MNFIAPGFASLSNYVRKIEKVHVFVSSFLSPYTNLAIESMLFGEYNVCHNNCVFIWRNSPSIIIGRFQNPWEECELNRLKISDTNLCRRNSGGGAVYHDLGNVNFTFFAPSKTFDRSRFTNFLAELLNTTYGKNVTATPRHDLLIDNSYKISGSSARIVKNCAYHHCTLLCHSNLSHVRTLLTPPLIQIESNATKSVKSQVQNLFEIFEDFNYTNLINCFSDIYVGKNSLEPGSIVYLHDSSILLNEIDGLKNKFSSWNWIYGQTPEFTVKIPSGTSFLPFFNIKVVNGVIQNIWPDDSNNTEACILCKKLLEALYNCSYCHYQVTERLIESIKPHTNLQ